MPEGKKTTEKDPSFTKSILRTLHILDQFAAHEELGIKDLSTLTQLPASTVQRIVNTLESENYLKQNPDSHKYRLGMAFFNISRHYSNSNDWVEVAKRHMERMVERHQETINIATLQGYNVMYLAKVESPHILRPNFPVGLPFPAACTSLGRCMLAYQRDVNLEEALTKVTKPTEKTIMDPEALRRELDKIREDGYAMEDEEFQSGLLCIAAPIRDADSRVIAAISTTIPKTRLEIAQLPTMIREIKETADAISEDVKEFFQFS